MNDYFDSQDFQSVPFLAKARSAQINDLATSVEQGFDRLPSAALLNQDRTTYAADTGAVNALVVALPTAPSSYADGLTIRVKVANTNTGPCTINVNGLGPAPITKSLDDPLSAGDIEAGQVMELTYLTSGFQITTVPNSVAAGASGAAVSAAAAAASAVTAAGQASAAASSAVAAAASALSAQNAAANVLYIYGGTSGGSANAQTLTPTPSLSALTAGNRITFIAGASNTAAMTLNVSGLGAKSVKRSDGTASDLGDVVSGSIYTVVYDGTNFRLTEVNRNPAAIRTPDVFSGTGAQTNFTLSVDPQTENAIDVFISGVYQPKTAYSVSGTTLTFSVAPANVANNIQVEFRGTQGVTGTPTDGTVSTAKIVDRAVTLAKMELGTRGDIIYYGSGGAPARLAAGSAGQALLSGGAGADPAWGTPAGVLTGSVVEYHGYSLPANYLWADGSAVSRATYAALYAVLCPSLGNFTVTIATPGVFTLTAHKLRTGMKVRLSTSGALPTGLAVNTDYYVNRTGADTFSLSLTRGGSNIATSGGQSGTHSLQVFNHGAGDGSTTFNVPDRRDNYGLGAGAMGDNAAGIVDPARSGVYSEAPGFKGGEEMHTLVLAEAPAHKHGLSKYSGTTSSGPNSGGSNNGSGTQSFLTNHMDFQGGDGAHNNMPPTYVCNYIIRT